MPAPRIFRIEVSENIDDSATCDALVDQVRQLLCLSSEGSDHNERFHTFRVHVTEYNTCDKSRSLRISLGTLDDAPSHSRRSFAITMRLGSYSASYLCGRVFTIFPIRDTRVLAISEHPLNLSIARAEVRWSMKDVDIVLRSLTRLEKAVCGYAFLPSFTELLLYSMHRMVASLAAVICTSPDKLYSELQDHVPRNITTSILGSSKSWIRTLNGRRWTPSSLIHLPYVKTLHLQGINFCRPLSDSRSVLNWDMKEWYMYEWLSLAMVLSHLLDDRRSNALAMDLNVLESCLPDGKGSDQVFKEDLIKVARDVDVKHFTPQDGYYGKKLGRWHDHFLGRLAIISTCSLPTLNVSSLCNTILDSIRS